MKLNFRKTGKLFLISLLIVSLLLGIGVAIKIITLPPEKLGFIQQSIVDADITITETEHEIEDINQVKSIIDFLNEDSLFHKANITVKYKDSSNEVLAQETFIVSLEGYATTKITRIVTLDVSRWSSVTILINQIE